MFNLNDLTFFETQLEARSAAQGAQVQTALYVRLGAEDIAFARAETVPELPGHAALHIKVLNAKQAEFKGRGIGTLLTTVFAAHLYQTQNRVLISSRSNSHDALWLWQGLVRRGLARIPKDNDLTFLLNNGARAEQGLPDKFKPGVYPPDWFTDPARRFEVRINAILDETETLSRARSRWERGPIL